MENSSQPELQTAPHVISVTKAQVLKNKKANDKGSAEDILIRIGYLEKVEEELFKKLGYPPTRQQILDEMKRIGFEMSLPTLWRDRAKIQKKQTFFRNLIAEGNFSAIMYHNAELLDYLEEQAVKYLNLKWTNSKSVKKSDLEGGDGKLEETKTEELATPKYNFMYILTRVVELRNKLFNEDTLNLDAAILSEDYQQTKAKNEALERTITELQKELKEALKGAKTPKVSRS